VKSRDFDLWRRRPVLGWALYDCANSAFALTVMTSFVPIMLAGYWNDGAASAVGTFRLGVANGVASLTVALLAPLMGAAADRSGKRKRWLLWLTSMGAVTTAGMYLVTAGHWQTGLALYMTGSVAFAAANSLYDSLLVDVADVGSYDRVSAYGYALGYLGSSLLFLLNVLMVARPDVFGLESRDSALRIAFLLVALWWVAFSIPLALWVHDDKQREGGPGVLVSGFRELRRTLREARQHPHLLRFIVAYWLYIDGVYTIIKMAVDYGLSLGLTAQDLVQAILATNLVAFPAALVFGRLAAFIGPRQGILVGLSVYIVATVAAPFVQTAPQFYALAIAVGLVQGGVQALSRSLFARLVPPGHSAEYFGFYNMLGKFAAIIGPLLAGTAALVSGSQRFGIVSLLILFAAGTWLLSGVRAEGEMS